MTDLPPSNSAADKPPGPASRLGLTVMVAVLAIDQITKLVAHVTLDGADKIDLLPILSLYLTQNTGVAFSFLRGTDSSLMLVIVGLITAIVLMLWVRSNEGGRLATIGFGLIVGGAIGNIVDRVLQGYVIDFLELSFGDRTLFIFNLADFALTVGPLLLIVAYWRAARRPGNPDSGSA